ncbi:MAG: NDP-sugar synthase [Candidatus Bathyarchaeia archaeon]
MNEGLRALILAGGYATRLRPLSCTRPKALFPVAGKPMLEWLLDGLSAQGIEAAVLAVNYLEDRIKLRFGSRHGDMRIKYSKEPHPLGTAGPIKYAKGLLEGHGPFLVLNGDIMNELSVADMLEFHMGKGAAATMALHEVEDASRFGAVELGEGMGIKRFVEKPKPGHEPSRLINAGMYILEPEVFDLIPDGRKVSLEREIFPKLAEAGRLFGYRYEGLWLDIGKFDDYIRANRVYLERVFRNPRRYRLHALAPPPNAAIEPPSFVSDEAKIGEGARVGPYASIGEGSVLARRAQVKESILFEGVEVGEGSVIEASIIGEGCRIGRGVRIGPGCVLGDMVQINDGVAVSNGAVVCHFKEIDANVSGPATVF